MSEEEKHWLIEAEEASKRADKAIDLAYEALKTANEALGK